VPKFDGFFFVYHKYAYLYEHVNEVCALSLFMGIVALSILTFTSYINGLYSIQIPDVLLVVILSTVALHLVPEIYQNNCVGIVGNIPSRLPNFVLPDINVHYLLPMLRSSVVIAIVTGTMNITLVKSIAKTYNYEGDISDRKELFAYSMACLIGPLFESFLPSGALSRSLVLASVGARSNLASLFSVPCLVFILKFLTGFLSTLPNPILAALIIIAVQSTLKQFLSLRQLWQEKRREFVEWMVTFIVAMVLDIEYGLFSGIAVSLFLNQLYNK